MKLTVLGSGSAGNCYLLHNDRECLVLEAGMPFMTVKKALDFDLGKIAAVVVSHEHSDHAKHIEDYAFAGIPLVAPFLCWVNIPCMHGGFMIQSFELVHDVPCYGFLIQHPDIGRLLFAMDTEYIKYRFGNLNHILIECNYGKEFMDSAYSQSLRERVWTSHMELETCKDFIRANQHDGLKTVCLLHLSDYNSNEAFFRDEISGLVSCPVYIAAKGLEIEL